jgi:sodium/bile acid cotransporter 7
VRAPVFWLFRIFDMGGISIVESLPKPYRAVLWVRRYWFPVALLAICLATFADHSGVLAAAGRWLKNHRGPDAVVVTIFLLSGFSLSPEQLRNGLMDVRGVLLAFAVIFVAAPLVAAAFGFVPMDEGILVGLFLVAVMPSTLSSGVVMTAAAGGSAAHALVTTIAANATAVFTIPYALSWLLASIGLAASVTIDKAAIMLKIGLLVVLPLALGMAAKHFLPGLYHRFQRKISIVNQCMILFIVWIAMSQTRSMLVGSGFTAAAIVGMVFAYHGVLLGCAWGLIRVAGRRRGARESILFMGGQKTLPLSIILQMSLFPGYGIALLVCVLHHIVHLMMDGYLVERLRKGPSS